MNKKFDRNRGFADNEAYIIEGRNSVFEALRTGRTVDKILYAEGDNNLNHIIAAAKQAGAVVKKCDRKKLDFISTSGAHQGIIAFAAAHEYSTVDDILKAAKDSGRPPLVVVCDEISDPHNLGAIIRSAEAAGAHGVIIPKRRNAGLSAVVAKVSSGALEHIPVARVSNIAATLDELKKRGLWIYGTGLGAASSSLYETDLRGAVAIVIGSEGDGMGRLVTETCDVVMNIPMLGKTQSLNASAAAAVVLFEVVRQRM
ncbi:MAG: 23S rRNA (guanosine(2251)-2'-O)-methyltransferase RlmB [Oscillospiraceae bacterium]|nr:23S rRNA (guanosine(2251)-2'-O)-methyltransferase RlmB [Oscillospiraceae bacterium]